MPDIRLQVFYPLVTNRSGSCCCGGVHIRGVSHQRAADLTRKRICYLGLAESIGLSNSSANSDNLAESRKLPSNANILSESMAGLKSSNR